MNTAGPIGQAPTFKEDGAMRTWVDGQLVLEETSMLWRQYNNITIDVRSHRFEYIYFCLCSFYAARAWMRSSNDNM